MYWCYLSTTSTKQVKWTPTLIFPNELSPTRDDDEPAVEHVFIGNDAREWKHTMKKEVKNF